ncbi:major facilitator superfamily domain-containing protein [Penicillium mononematosum]|uniref:major facilitator superfamily domain-containing protein n=1 Tax=Penicillium mononematosum TaxID=268346 RepID=UPI0025492453|nr:major facilitator superfamily domain-containing protein [Penicillium mononematosum]KAJ6184688.1 major facilitator superfamily domain-containing protein [Penicillium mononematosum]
MAHSRISLVLPNGSSSNPDIPGDAANERTSLLKPNESGNHLQSNDSDPQEEDTAVTAKELPFHKLAIIFSTAWVGVFLGAVDSTIIATLSAPISSEFQSLSLLSWLATAYLISNAVCQPISGRLTDIFGRGPGLIFSNIFFAAGNLICGFATNESQIILGRVIAGIGGGGLMSIATFLSSDLIPLRKRGVVQGILNVCFGSGAMLGGVIGGLLNDQTKLGWRLAFIIQAPPTLLSAVGVYFFVRIPPKQSHKAYIARIDFLGVSLIVSFLVLLLVGLTTGGTNVPWTHPLPLTTIPLSIVAFFAFLWWESRTAQPIIPVRLLAKRTVLAACLSNFFCAMVILSALFYIPLYLQIRGHSATNAGLLILSSSPVGGSCGSIGAGMIMNKTGKYTRLGVVSGIVMTSGVITFAFHDKNTPSLLTPIAFFLVGSGYGSLLTTTLLACIAAVEHAHQAVVTSATYMGRSVGSALGITISSAVYQNVLSKRLWDRFGNYPDSAKEIARIRNDIMELKHLPDGWYEGVIKSFMDAFHAVFLALLGMVIAGLVCASLMRQHTLHSTLNRDER